MKNNHIDEEKVVADMSNVEGRHLVLPKFLHQENKEEPTLNKEETKWYILGTLKASLLIALIYAAVFGMFILIIVLAYNYLIK